MAETSRTYYYARVSSSGQHLTRQLEKFYEMGAESRDIITDKESKKTSSSRSNGSARRRHRDMRKPNRNCRNGVYKMFADHHPVVG